MLPTLWRRGSTAPWRDPFGGDDFFGLSRDFESLTDTWFSAFPFLGRSSGTWPSHTRMWSVPAAEVTETEDGYRFSLEAPGFDEEDLDVTVDGSVLRVRGHRHDDHEDSGVRYWIRERHSGHFERSYVLPDTVDRDGIRASYANGVLKIEMPKHETARPRRIKISKPKILDRLTSGRKKGAEETAA